MTTNAIVIKTHPLREHDLAVILYSADSGKCTAVARSALKTHSVQGRQLDAGNIIQCELVAGRGMPIITGARAERCFSNAKSSPVRWAAAQFFLQVIDSSVYDAQPDQALFDCVAGTLEALDGCRDDAAAVVMRQKQQDMLAVLGYGGAAADVAVSGRPGRTALDDAFERIAQRSLGTLDVFYELVGR